MLELSIFYFSMEYPSDQKLQSQFSHNGMFVISNPNVIFPKTEVTVRIRGKGNQLQTRKGFVE
jgi:hypothetical protein